MFNDCLGVVPPRLSPVGGCHSAVEMKEVLLTRSLEEIAIVMTLNFTGC